MTLPVTISGISTAVAPVGPFKSTNASITISIGTTQASGQFGSTSYPYTAQSFTSTASMPLNTIEVDVCNFGSPTDGVIIDLYLSDASDHPAGDVIASTNEVSHTGLQTYPSHGLVTFTFSSPPTLTASTRYCAVFRRTGSLTEITDYYVPFRSLGSSYSDGANSYYLGGTGWQDAIDADLRMVVHGSGTAYYFFGRYSSAAGTLQAYKSTDPTTSWDSVSGNTGVSNAILALAGYQVGDVIHLIRTSDVAGQSHYSYWTFDMSSDTWPVNAETIQSAVTTNGQTGLQQVGCSVVVRSDGHVVAFFNGAQTKKSGTYYARVYWSERTAVNTWSAPVQVDDGGITDNTQPEAAINGLNDSVHLMWYGQIGNFCQRTLSAANVLQTTGTSLANTGHGLGYPRVESAAYNSSGTIKVVCSTAFDAGTGDLPYTFYFDSGNTPTLSHSGPQQNGNSLLSRIFVDGTDVWIVYADYPTGDVYAKKSTDHGATWGSATAVFSGITVIEEGKNLSHDGGIYQRENSIVIPYLVNDNGTLKYNEHVVRTLIGSWLGTASFVGESATAFSSTFVGNWMATAVLGGTSALAAATTTQTLIQATAVLDGTSVLAAATASQTLIQASFVTGVTALAIDVRFPFNTWEGASLLAGAGNAAVASSVRRTARASLGVEVSLSVKPWLRLTALARFAGAGAFLLAGQKYIMATARFAVGSLSTINTMLPVRQFGTAHLASVSEALVANSMIVGPPDLRQSHFRIRTDTLVVNANPTWAADMDVNCWPGTQPFRLRVAVDNAGAFTGPAEKFYLYVSRNGGAWQLVTAGSDYVRATNAGASLDEAVINIPRLSS